MIKPKYNGDGYDLRDVKIRDEWDECVSQVNWSEYLLTENSIYHVGFEDGIKFFLRHLYTTAPVSSIEAREWGETLNAFRRWKSADEWTKLIEGEV